jgi:hypothetical protein
MKRVIIFAAVTVTAAVAQAQPVPDVPLPPDLPTAPTEDPKPEEPTPIPRGDATPTTPVDPYPTPPPPKAKKKRVPTSKWCQWEERGSECMPEVLTTPTGWLLPGAMLYSRTGLDTGGGVSSDSRVGLGEVAEFGVATSDQVRARESSTDITTSRIQPYVTASFRLGIQEGRLFDAQPGVTLGFRKSFERNRDNFKTKTAELTLVMSKHLGNNAAVHIGGAFWDASLEGNFEDDAIDGKAEVTLHGFDDTVKKQVRPFGGIELRPLPSSQILVDIGWAPEFCYQCSNFGDQANGAAFGASKIRLKPVLSWGVRTQLAKWMRLEAGVRLPDIGEANLLDAQIFGQVTFTSSALRSAVESLQ